MRKIRQVIFAILIVFMLSQAPVFTNDGTVWAAEGDPKPLPTIGNSLSQYHGTVGTTFTMEIDPFNYNDPNDLLEEFSYLFMAEKSQTRIIIESVDLPKAYAVDVNGKKYGVSYALYDIEVAQKAGTEYILDLDYDQDYLTITREQIQDQSNGLPVTFNFLIMRLVDQGTLKYVMKDLQISEFHTSGPVKINYRINEEGTTFANREYAYMIVRSDIVTNTRVDKSSATNRNVYKLLFFINSEVEITDSIERIRPSQSDEEFSAMVTISNTGQLNNGRLQLRFKSDHYDVIGEEWIDKDGEKVMSYVDSDGKFLVLPIGATVDIPIKYRLKENVAPAESSYTISLANDRMSTHYSIDTKNILFSSDYSVKYDSNEMPATVPIDTREDYVFDSLVQIKDILSTPEDYNFLGWNTKKNGSGVSVNSSDEVKIETLFSASRAIADEQITLYAQWEKQAPLPIKVTAIFVSNGGSAIEAVTTDINTPFPEPILSTKEDYTFMGWFTEAEHINKYDFSTLATADITLYAKWQEDETVLPGTVTSPKTGHSNSLIPLLFLFILSGIVIFSIYLIPKLKNKTR